MTVEELRTWLRKRLAVEEDGFNAIWRQLGAEHYISEFADPDNDYDKEGVLSTARKKIRDAREIVYGLGGSAPLGASNGQKNASSNEPQNFFLDVDLDPHEVERARAYEEITAREAALNQGPDGSYPLADWRRKVLGERLLTLEQAHELLESPAARFLPLDLFRQWKIPIVGHKATELSYDQGAGKFGVDHRVTIEIWPPGITKTVWYSDASASPADTEPDVRIPVRSKDAEGKMHMQPTERVLRYKDRDDLNEKIWVWPGSLLDTLRLLGAHWARMLGWAEEEMTMWLLTGKLPSHPPLVPKVSYKMGYPTVTLAIYPWLSADTVARNYRKLQHKLFGKEHRPLRPRSLAVLRFVERRTRETGGHRPSWSQLLEEWNAQCPAEWRCTDRSNFSRTYRKAFETVARQSVYLLGRKVSDAEKSRIEQKAAEAKRRLMETFGRKATHGYKETRYDSGGNRLTETVQLPTQTPANNNGDT